MLDKLHKWHNSKQGLVSFGLIEAILAYVFASLAIDSGSLIQWVLAIVLAVGAAQNLIRLAMKYVKKG